MMLSAQQMRSLPDFFADIPDPRRAQGRRHRLPTVLAIAAGGDPVWHARLQGHRGLGPESRPQGPERFRCRRDNDGRYLVPSESIIRDVMIRVDPVTWTGPPTLESSLSANRTHTLAIDGKTMCNALDSKAIKPMS